MKKFIFVFALSTVLISCGKSTSTPVNTDSISVDTTVVDSATVDSSTVDSVAE